MAKAANPDHVNWSKSYSVGIELIDNQHKSLINCVNEMFSHEPSGKESIEMAYFSEVIHRMVEYSKKHFATEEKIMTAYRYPEYEEHKKAHDAFILEIIRSAKEYESGKRLVLTKLARFLRNWILAHIAVMDNKYAAYFRLIATRKADGSLSVTSADIQPKT